MYDIEFKDALYFIVICAVVLGDIWQNGLFYRQQIDYTSQPSYALAFFKND